MDAALALAILWSVAALTLALMIVMAKLPEDRRAGAALYTGILTGSVVWIWIIYIGWTLWH